MTKNEIPTQRSCSTLGLKQDVNIADELLTFNWEPKSHDDFPTADRLSVGEYLKQQYRDNMLARYPNFEATTENDIARLKLEMDQMFVFNMIIVMLLGVLIVLGGWLLILMA